MLSYENKTVKELKTLASKQKKKGRSFCKTKKELISLLRYDKPCKKRSVKRLVKKRSPKCTKRNPAPDPDCKEGFYKKFNPKGEECCYKTPNKRLIIKPTTTLNKNITNKFDIFFSSINCDNFDKYYKKYMSKVLGEGSYGKVYEYCVPKNQKKDCDYALKIINNVPEKEFKDELRIGQIASNKGIGPKIYKGTLCKKGGLFSKNIGLIFMDKLKGQQFADYLNKNIDNNTLEVKKVIDRVFKKISDFHKLGYVHLDTHGGNIWVNPDKSVYLLDYGFTLKSSKKEDRRDDFGMFTKDVIEDLNYYGGDKYGILKDYVKKKALEYVNKL